jgi:pectate lyase-like protein
MYKKRILSVFILSYILIVSSCFAVNKTSIEFPQRGENVTWTENGTAVPSDSSDDSSAFNTALSRIGSREVRLILPSGTYDIINNDVTFPANIELVFLKGAKLNISSGITVTINGEIEAGHSQIFGGDGTITGDLKVEYVIPQWFGAKGDGTTNDGPAIQNAIDFCVEHDLSLKIPYSPNKYLIESDVNLEHGIKISGMGENVSASNPDCATFLLDNAGFIADERMIISLKNLAFEGVNKSETAIEGSFGGFLENILFTNLDYAVNNISGYYSHYDNIRISYCNKGLVIGVANICTISRLGSNGCPEPIDTSANQAFSLNIRDCLINVSSGISGGMVKVGAGANIKNMYFESFSSTLQNDSAAIEVIHSRFAYQSTTINNIYINNVAPALEYGIILNNPTSTGETNKPQCIIKNVYFSGTFSGGKIYYGLSYGGNTYYNNIFALIDLESCRLQKSDLVNKHALDPMMNGSVIEFETNRTIAASETQICWNPNPTTNLCGFYFTGTTQLKNLYLKGYYLSNFNFELENTSSISKTITIRIYVDGTVVESFPVTIGGEEIKYVPFTSVLFIDRAKIVSVKAINGDNVVIAGSGRVSLVRIMQR